MARVPGQFQAAVIALAVIALVLLQAVVVPLAMTNAQSGAAVTAFIGFENYWALVRSFEFRRVLVNTFWVLALALVMIVPAGRAGAYLIQRAGRRRRLLLIVFFVPLALPGVPGVLAWRSLLDMLHLPLDQRWIVLPVFAAVQAWRAFPLTMGIYCGSPVTPGGSRLGVVSAVAAYWILVDVSVVMLLTGGAPHNATHVLASWSYVTAVTDGQIGLGAAMTTVLLAALWLVSATLVWHGLSRPTRRRVQGHQWPNQLQADDPHAPAAGRTGDWVALSVLLLWLLPPLAAVLAEVGWPWQGSGALRFLATESGYIGWLGSTLLLVAGAGLVAIWLAPSSAAWLALRSNRIHDVIGLGMAAVALTTLPVAYVPLLWFEERNFVPRGLLGLGLLYAIGLLSLGTGLVTLIRPHPDRNRYVRAGLMLAALFLATQESSSALALVHGPLQTLNTGLVNQLAYRVVVPPTTTAVAVVIACLLFGTLYGALVRFTRQ